MASILNCKNGTRAVILSPGEGPETAGVAKRPRIGLGKVTKRQAQTVLVHIEDLCRARKTGSAPSNATADWAAGLCDSIYQKLVTAGLAESRIVKTDRLADFIADYISKRSDVKPGTRITFRNVQRNLIDFLGNPLLSEITEQDAHDFRAWMITNQKLAENTVRKRCSIASQFFNAARRGKKIADNPFDSKGIPRTARENSARFYFITEDEADAVLAACPDEQWRCILTLCRWGGLRCPSEVMRLKWEDVDFENRQMIVHASKTEHHENGGIRKVPLFPRVEAVLAALYAERDPDYHEYVITCNRRNTKNLRTQLTRIIRKAGLKPWPKLFQNLRSTCETELFRLTNGNVKAVCTWIGNSPAVAMKHYAQVTDEDVDFALDAAQRKFDEIGCNRTSTTPPAKGTTNPATESIRIIRQDHAVRSMKHNENGLKCAKTQSFLGKSARRVVGVTGFEPVTSTV